MSNAMIATKKREKKSSNETKESVTKKRFWATRTIIASPIITTMHRTNPVSSARKRMSVQRYALFPLSRGGRCFSILRLSSSHLIHLYPIKPNCSPQAEYKIFTHQGKAPLNWVIHSEQE